MKSFKWQIIIILLAGLVVGLLLLSEQTGFRLVSPVPTRGGVFTEGLVGKLQRLNPVLDYYNQADRDIDRLIFSSLIKFDAQGLPVADLASSWGVSFDGLTYNFELRDNAVWHDGEPITAEDVLFTINLMRDPNSVLPEDLITFWGEIEVNVLSEKALQIKIKEPFSPLIDYLSFGILPKHLLGGTTYSDIINSEFNLTPVGSGPYKFSRVVSEGNQITGVILNSNSDYYGNAPFLKEFVFKYYPDSASAFNAYLQGAVNGVSDLDKTILAEALRNPGLSVYSAVKPEIAMVLFNLNNSKIEFLQDKNIRRALLMGLDRRGMINTVLHGQGVIADVPLLPNTWAYYANNPRVDQNVQQAGDILKEAGFLIDQAGSGVRKKNGVELSFNLVHPDDTYHTLIAEAIKSDWAKLGVNIQLIAVPYDTLVLDHLQPLTYEAALVDLNYSRSPDPDPYPFWDQAEQAGGQNYSQWEDRVASQYLEEARVTKDLGERAKLYRNFQVIFSEELPALPLFYPVYNFGVDGSIQDVRVGPMFDQSDRFWNISDWFLLAQSSPNQ
ncbi:MAG: peptide ABC transporter substrate-binding protein [Pelolinea sp.]|nr:peptide ABC transporter substrate-binding protein [Pelolinea sp.]